MKLANVSAEINTEGLIVFQKPCNKCKVTLNGLHVEFFPETGIVPEYGVGVPIIQTEEVNPVDPDQTEVYGLNFF